MEVYIKMKAILGNVWIKRIASLVSISYAIMVCCLCYRSIFFNIEISSAFSLCMFVSGVSLISLVIMLYSRKQVLTRLASVIILPAMLPVVLLYFGKWSLIIPIIATGIIILLLSGSGEGFKTAFGTVFLLMYIFGALAYFLASTLFVTTTITHTVDSGVSPSGLYRYYVVNTEDSSNGSTAVSVEPNYADEHIPFATFTLKEIERVVYLERPMAESADIQWTTQSRSEITSYLNSISDAITVHLSESQLKKLGYTYDNKLELMLSDLKFSKKKELGKTASDVDDIPLDNLTDDQLSVMRMAKDESGRYYIKEMPEGLADELGKKANKRVYLSSLTDSQMSEYFCVEKDTAVYLKDLTDEQLASFGVPESGDVMTYNGKVCFRYYVAILENYFDVDDRTLSFSLIS